MVGIVETEVDKLTGKVDIIDYVAVVDCGTVVNPNLARIQAEGGIAQGIGMALYEDITYTEKGKMRNDSFLQYKIPTRLDVGNIRVEFESSFEQTGPFGAKSIGEIVINTPSPALAHAVYNATKVNIRTLPITSEKIVMGMIRNNVRHMEPKINDIISREFMGFALEIYIIISRERLKLRKSFHSLNFLTFSFPPKTIKFLNFNYNILSGNIINIFFST